MDITLVVALVVLLAAFTQSLTGFGSALVAMAVLPAFIDVRVAAPLVALLAGSIEVVLLVRYRQAVDLRAVWRLVAAMVPGVVLGLYFLSRVPEQITLRVLGVVIAGYSLYSLFVPRLPALEGSLWAYLTGFLSGLLGGAYNTSGPPVVIYGHCRRWLPEQFKGNLQGFFLAGDALVVAGHLINGNVTPAAGAYYLTALPALAAGIALGVLLDKRVNPELFRRGVLVLLFVMGARMVLG